MNTHLSEYTLGGPVAPFPGIPSPRMASWAVSTDGGAHFTDKGPVPPISTITNGSTIITNGASNALYGDAGDTTIGYDPQKGVVYLLANPSRENTNFYGFRLWASRDNGQTFGPVNMDVPGRDINGSHFISVADKPALRLSGTNIYVAGSESGPRVWAAHSSNAGTNWDAPHILDTASNGDVRGVDILIVPDGTVYYFWLSSSGTANQLRYTYLATNGAWATTANIGSILNSTNTVNGSGNLLRYNGANSNDYFIDNCFPKACYANGNIYIVYADTPTSTPTTDRGDIFMLEASVNWSTHALAVSTGPKKVNNDRTQTDQWDPSIAANPSGTEVFVGYYSRQNDPVTNSWIMAYGAKAYMTNGLANATFECFPVSPTSFQPVFAGTSATPSNPLTYDPVWPPPGICLDGNAVFNGLHTPGIFCPPGVDGPEPDGTIGEYMNFCADDYTCSAADAAYFYLAWCDRTRVYQMTRPDADIKFARVRQ